jgi:XapX domain-containing protein
MRTYPSALSSGGVSSVGEICPRDCMRPHVEPTVNKREPVSARVPVVRQYGEVAFALVEAMTVGFYCRCRTGRSPADPAFSGIFGIFASLRVDGASIAADLASVLDHRSRRLRSTSETDKE